MKTLVIFYICALPQLYIKQNQSNLRLDPPPLEKFSGSAPALKYYFSYLFFLIRALLSSFDVFDLLHSPKSFLFACVHLIHTCMLNDSHHWYKIYNINNFHFIIYCAEEVKI